MKQRKRDYHPYIDEYMDNIRSGKIPSSEEIKLAMDYIEFKLDDPDVFIDIEKIEKAVELITIFIETKASEVELIERYFEFKLLDWELLYWH